MTFFQFLAANKPAALAFFGPFALWLWSEVLGSSDKFKSSSVYELVLNALKSSFGGAKKE